MIDRQKLLQAVNHLVTSPMAERHIATMHELAKLPAGTPVLLTGEAEPLNALLELLRTDPAGYARVMAMVDKRREDRGWGPLVPPEQDGFNRNEYQRDFMHQKRVRERRAVEIENLLRPGRDKLIGNARLEFMRRASAGWKKRRDALLDNARSGSSGTLSKEQISAILEAFWRTIDNELDQAEAEAIKKIRRL
jgi:hypothetical protein